MMDCAGSRKLTRRQFLSFAGLSVASLGAQAVPGWVRRAAAAAGSSKNRKVLVVLFQRGAADGLNIVPPFLDPAYHKARPSISIADPADKDAGALDLDGRFGLHPRLSPLLPLWKEGRFAVVHAVGSPESTRSHFDAQDYMESGTPGVKKTEDGWLNRALGVSGVAREPMAAVAISNRLPRTLRGAFPVLAMANADQLRAGGPMVDSFESIYDETMDALLSGPVHDVGQARRMLGGLPKFAPDDMEKGGYPKGRVGRDFFELARVIKADVGLRVGFLEAGGWDHHFNEGGADGQLARRLEELGTAIAAFYRDLGDLSGEVLLVTMTEFGRALEENGNRGTDHGHASVMMLFGGGVKGGKVYGRWPGLAREQLFEERDLQVTTDFRRVLSEALAGHQGIRDLAAVFPGGPFPPVGYLP